MVATTCPYLPASPGRRPAWRSSLSRSVDLPVSVEMTSPRGADARLLDLEVLVPPAARIAGFAARERAALAPSGGAV